MLGCWSAGSAVYGCWARPVEFAVLDDGRSFNDRVPQPCICLAIPKHQIDIQFFLLTPVVALLLISQIYN